MELDSCCFWVWPAFRPAPRIRLRLASQNSSSGSSLGDYARQVRKDPGSTAKPKVFDNDNLPREDKLSIVGQPAAPAAGSDTDAKATQAENCHAERRQASVRMTKLRRPREGPATSTPKAPDDEKTKEAGGEAMGRQARGAEGSD